MAAAKHSLCVCVYMCVNPRLMIQKQPMDKKMYALFSVFYHMLYPSFVTLWILYVVNKMQN
jgi:hypothetical protein